MNCYIVQHKQKGFLLRPGPYGKCRWTDNIIHAKLYNKIGAAKNAVNCRIGYEKLNREDFVIEEYEIVFNKIV